MDNCITLYELTHMVRETIEDNLSWSVWLQAELSAVSQRGPHCYLEFVQKANRGNTFVAKAKGNIWGNRWNIIRPYFERVTGQPLSMGMQVMVQVEPTFHEIYGFSLNVLDINPTFTLGDMARRRQEILRRLSDEGIAEMNKELSLPVPLRRIAIISSETAAGYTDFLDQLIHNDYGLRFTAKLFPAIMQGEHVERSIISALNAVADELDNWDVVVIIRGGGATSDLTGFDSLPLAEHVAQFPLPIITGIGHERDDTVIDLISHTRVKTPTAAAEFIVRQGVEQLELIDSLSADIQAAARQVLHQHRLRLDRLTQQLPSLFELYENGQLRLIDRLQHTITATTQSLMAAQQLRLQRLDSNVSANCRQLISDRRHQLQLISTRIDAARPDRLLQLGFSIVRLDGKAVRDSSSLQSGQTVDITLSKGTVKAVVK